MFRALLGILKAVWLAVESAVRLVVKLVYGILKFLRIRLLALYVVVCAILSVFLPVFGAGIVYFWVGFALCCAVTAGSWMYTIWRKISARPRPAEEREGEEEAQQNAPAPQPSAPQPPQPSPPPERYPKYFDVEGAPQYFFAEYADRYELYLRDGESAVYIRTDFKQ